MDSAIAERYPRQRLSAGTTLCREGESGASMYLVIDGRLEVSKRVIEGADKVLDLLGAGEYVGEMSLLTGARRSATVRAVEDTEVVEIDQQTFLQLLPEQPQIGLDLMRQMARRLDKSNEELVLLALEVALSQRAPQRAQSGSQRMRFVATGSFEGEQAAEVRRIASEQAAQTVNPALVTSLLLPGRTHRALVYVIETDSPRDLMELVSPFGGLVQWDIAPAIEVNAAQPIPESSAAESPASFLSL